MSRQRIARSLSICIFFVAVSAGAQVTQLGPLIPDGLGKSDGAPHAQISDLLFSAPRLSSTEKHSLGSLTTVERTQLSSSTGSPGQRALKVGIDRKVPFALGFDWESSGVAIDGTRTVGGGLLERAGDILVWTTAIRSENADALRLQIEGSLPSSARVYIYASSGEVHGPYSGRDLEQDGFWTNTIYADEIFMEVQFLERAQAAGASLRVNYVAHIESPAFATAKSGEVIRPDGTECFLDVTCVANSEFPQIAVAGRAMAQLVFSKNSSTFVCSGGLLNNTREDFIPYFLTANHCFDTQASATSLEATWNYKTTDCSDPNVTPNRALFPRSLGSTLLATSATSDFTFLRLSQAPPSGAIFLGWDGATNVATTAGTALYRVHHPQGATQFYARHAVTTTSSACSTLPRGNYIYTTDEVAGAAGGSSGSPVMLLNLTVVGQLRGACGPNVADDCDRANRTVDGAFRVSFPSIQSFLAPTAGPGPCVPSNTTACILNGRFKATVRYRGAFDNNAADTDAFLKSVTGFASPTFETAFFFFNSANNIEMLVKMLDQGNTDSSGRPTIAVLFGTATPLRIELTITDTTNGVVKQYRSDFAQARGTTDFTAFVK